MDNSPYTIGYWARHHNLNLVDLLGDETFGPLLDSDAQREEFDEGWQVRQDESHYETLEKLRTSLSAATGKDLDHA